MKRERVCELLPIMQAFAEGKEIQFRPLDENASWIECPNPSWEEDVEYRIKPEKCKDCRLYNGTPHKGYICDECKDGDKFEPKEYDLKYGQMIDLTKSRG